MAKVVMYATGVCPFCLMAERLLKSKGVADIEKIRVDLEPQRRQEMMQRTGRRTVPQIYVGERHVGGYDDLAGTTLSIRVFGIECRCLTLDKLIEVKRAAGRPKDFEAIAELEAIRDERSRGGRT